MKYPRISCILAALPLMSCATPGVFWYNTAHSGPLIPKGERPQIQEKCGTVGAMSSRGSNCQNAFIDQDGRRNDINDIIRRIDAHLQNVPQLAPWITPWPSNGSVNKGRAPYKLYLLTISPIIIFAVPEADGKTDSCGSDIFRVGCLPSRSLNQNAYWFREAPPVLPGSFWFSPDFSSGVVPIILVSQTYQITNTNVALTLSIQNEHWVVSRDR